MDNQEYREESETEKLLHDLVDSLSSLSKEDDPEVRHAKADRILLAIIKELAWDEPALYAAIENRFRVVTKWWA